MSVISVTITESSRELIAGVPVSITVLASIPSTIFYTLDGSDPDFSSSVYVGPIILPTNSVTVKIRATNGVDDSGIIIKTYNPNLTEIRKPHASVVGLTPGIGTPDLFPYGDNAPLSPVHYSNASGITVDAPDIPNIPDGYDGTGTNTHSNGTDLPLTSYQFIYSTANSLGETGHGIGTLPANTVMIPSNPKSPESSNTSDRFFNPRAMVIYQDSRNPPFDDISMVNRANFSLQNPERSRNGALVMNTAFDSSSITGTFLRQQYSPRDNTITYYYRDSDTGRWIISVEPYMPKNNNINALSRISFSNRGDGSRFVYQWVPFMYRRLI